MDEQVIDASPGRQVEIMGLLMCSLEGVRKTGHIVLLWCWANIALNEVLTVAIVHTATQQSHGLHL